jgi:hypothetical protein
VKSTDFRGDAVLARYPNLWVCLHRCSSTAGTTGSCLRALRYSGLLPVPKP